MLAVIVVVLNHFGNMMFDVFLVFAILFLNLNSTIVLFIKAMFHM